MNLMDAVEASLSLARMGEIQTGRVQELVDGIDDFWTNNWENVEAEYGAAERIGALQTDGAFPEVDLEALQNGAGDDLDLGMRQVIELALDQARDVDEVLVEGTALNSLEAVNFLAAFWASYGPEVCNKTVSFDVSGVLDGPGM